MRKGINPEKINLTKLKHKSHRVIVPFWIPNVTDDYFKHQPEILRLCLQSLINSIDFSRTNITLINNNSCTEATDIAEEFVKKGFIDKYVKQIENRGKLEVIIAEAKGATEDFITISDADMLFYSGWENTVIQIFTKFKRAGVVTCYPMPQHAFHFNISWIFTSCWKSGSIVEKKEMDLVNHSCGQDGLGWFKNLGVRKKYSWYDKQYYLQKDDIKVCLGASHALATMKRDIFQHLPFKKVEFAMKRSYIAEHLDYFSEFLGYYRLSTPKCWAYHMGDTLPDDEILKRKVSDSPKTMQFPEYKRRSGRYIWWHKKRLIIMVIFFHVFSKIKFI